MFSHEIEPAKKRIIDGIKFVRKGDGFFFPDTLVDSDAIRLLNVEYHPTKDTDELEKQFAGKTWLEIVD